MERLDATATRALVAILDAQPLTEAKVRFAWTMIAGPGLSRAASVTWSEQTLTLEPRTEAWRQELMRARPMLMPRLRELLGPGAVAHIRILDAPRQLGGRRDPFRGRQA